MRRARVTSWPNGVSPPLRTANNCQRQHTTRAHPPLYSHFTQCPCVVCTVVCIRSALRSMRKYYCYRFARMSAMCRPAYVCIEARGPSLALYFVYYRKRAHLGRNLLTDAPPSIGAHALNTVNEQSCSRERNVPEVHDFQELL